MIIVGAGLTGMLCGAMNPGSKIYEAGLERPNEHKAVLRMRSPKIGDMLGIPFKEVTVHKAIWYDGQEVNPTPRFAHMYSQKVAELYTARSVFNLSSGTRYVPPANFAEELKKRCDVQYDMQFDSTSIECFKSEPIISTIPMPALAKLSSVKIDADFYNFPIVVNQHYIQDCDSHCTIYYPDPGLPIYRATINGPTLIIESTDNIDDNILSIVCESFGISSGHAFQTIENHRQRAGKIRAIDQFARTNFITNMTLNHNVYSLGRYATWRPKVMLDDVCDDVLVIRRLINQGKYASTLHEQGDK